MDFKNWLENFEAKKNGIQGTVLDFLKDKLNISDDDTILTMPMSSIDPSVINDLMRRGIIQNGGSDLLNDIKNGTLTVADMCDRLAGDEQKPLLLPHRDI